MRSPKNGTSSPPLTRSDAAAAAKAANLKYVSDTDPGIRRKRKSKDFSYIGTDGKPVRDRETLARIKSLVIPPAYEDVWICAHPDGHIQVTGRDARGRKQYRYHPRWREVRDADKYDELLQFGRLLPQLRKSLSDDLGKRGLVREKVLATVVTLLDRTLIRIGNADYAKENKSYGLTTLRNKHVAVDGATLRFEFTGKSGKMWKLQIHDRRIARVVKACHDLPGQDLFQYVDEAGARHAVSSTDVNAYLKELSGHDITAKHFRTWSGTVLAAAALSGYETTDKQTLAKRNIKQAIEIVAKRLGNTPTICRKCYVHPEVIAAYLDGEQLRLPNEGAIENAADGDCSLAEAAFLDFLEKRLARQKHAARASSSTARRSSSSRRAASRSASLTSGSAPCA